MDLNHRQATALSFAIQSFSCRASIRLANSSSLRTDVGRSGPDTHCRREIVLLLRKSRLIASLRLWLNTRLAVVPAQNPPRADLLNEFVVINDERLETLGRI